MNIKLHIKWLNVENEERNNLFVEIRCWIMMETCSNIPDKTNRYTHSPMELDLILVMTSFYICVAIFRFRSSFVFFALPSCSFNLKEFLRCTRQNILTIIGQTIRCYRADPLPIVLFFFFLFVFVVAVHSGGRKAVINIDSMDFE